MPAQQSGTPFQTKPTPRSLLHTARIACTKPKTTGGLISPNTDWYTIATPLMLCVTLTIAAAGLISPSSLFLFVPAIITPAMLLLTVAIVLHIPTRRVSTASNKLPNTICHGLIPIIIYSTFGWLIASSTILVMNTTAASIPSYDTGIVLALGLGLGVVILAFTMVVAGLIIGIRLVYAALRESKSPHLSAPAPNPAHES